MTDAEFHGLIRHIGRERVKETVAALLAGNDAACFSTDQYAVMYTKLHWANDREDGLRLFRSDYQGETFAHWHLRTLAGFAVREVGAGVWAAVENENTRVSL